MPALNFVLAFTFNARKENETESYDHLAKSMMELIFLSLSCVVFVEILMQREKTRIFFFRINPFAAATTNHGLAVGSCSSTPSSPPPPPLFRWFYVSGTLLGLPPLPIFLCSRAFLASLTLCIPDDE